MHINIYIYIYRYWNVRLLMGCWTPEKTSITQEPNLENSSQRLFLVSLPQSLPGSLSEELQARRVTSSMRDCKKTRTTWTTSMIGWRVYGTITIIFLSIIFFVWGSLGGILNASQNQCFSRNTFREVPVKVFGTSLAPRGRFRIPLWHPLDSEGVPTSTSVAYNQHKSHTKGVQEAGLKNNDLAIDLLY